MIRDEEYFSGFTSRLNTAKEGISKLEYKSTEITVKHKENMREREKKKKEQSTEICESMSKGLTYR